MKHLIVLHFLLLSSTISLSQGIGIGTTDPSGKLEIYSNSSLSNPQLEIHEDGNDYARIRMQNKNSSNYWTIAAYVASNVRNDRLNFWNGVGGDVMSLTGDGQLGLGVGISPKTDLHVGNNKRVLFGTDTLGNGDKLMFLPDLHAFRVGTVSTGAASTYWNRDSIGLYSFASGINTRAQGIGATAMGRDTEATNSYAFATGYFSNADGQYSTAMGFNTDAFGLGATALGYSTDAEQNYTFAAGYFAEAQAIYSTAIGRGTRAQSYGSTAIGSYNIGGGSATAWQNEDPIFEIGIGESQSTSENALTVLKNGRHGIMTVDPKADLHIRTDGLLDQPTIVTILESGISNRPVLQFSETSAGDLGSGMSIEYDGRGAGSTNKMHINKTGGAAAMTIENSGQIGIGVTNPSFALHLPNSSSTGIARAHTWSTYSDRRIKSKASQLSYGLREIMLLEPLIYNQHNANFQNTSLILDAKSEKTIGLFAQDVYEIIPEAVLKPENENEQLWGMEYEKLIPVLVRGIQEQQEQIRKLTNKVMAQEATISKLYNLPQEMADLKEIENR